jgi:N-acetylglucosamine kinase-like BadF-type ATPase
MYLGIDGGGSKTAFALIDDAGRLRATHEASSLYYHEVGLENVEATLRDGLAATLAEANITPQELSFSFFGLPAYGEDKRLQALLDGLPGQLLGHQRYRCGNDMICSWAGSLACRDGISVIAGTGSMAYGSYQGRGVRVGGWGELFSDEGSAYWIARAGLTLFSRMSDGRSAKGPLHGLLRRHFALDDDLDLCAAIYGGDMTDRSKLARLSLLVAEAAAAGDVQARAIFNAAALELTEIVKAVGAQLGVPAGALLPVSYSGGVFNSGELVLAPFRAALAETDQNGPAYTLQTPVLPPVIGAAIHAAQLIGVEFSAAALAALAGQVNQSPTLELL